MADKYYWSPSTIRYWFIGRSLPQRDARLSIKEYLSEKIPTGSWQDEQIYEEIRNFFEKQGAIDLYYTLRRLYPSMNQFSGEVLSACYDMAKNKYPTDMKKINCAQATGKTQVVVFDFDGTLTAGKINKTTWESLWTSLDYDVKMCQDLHMRYDRNEISHKEWRKLTEQKFWERNLHRKTVENLASKIALYFWPCVKRTR